MPDHGQGPRPQIKERRPVRGAPVTKGDVEGARRAHRELARRVEARRRVRTAAQATQQKVAAGRKGGQASARKHKSWSQWGRGHAPAPACADAWPTTGTRMRSSTRSTSRASRTRTATASATSGLIERLDHIEGLGATCLWLLPFYVSPRRDNGYDVVDHCAVDERLGTLDVRRLVAELDRRDMRLMVNLVLNHTSDEHPWFRRALEDSRAPERAYYVFRGEAGAAAVHLHLHGRRAQYLGVRGAGAGVLPAPLLPLPARPRPVPPGGAHLDGADRPLLGRPRRLGGAGRRGEPHRRPTRTLLGSRRRRPLGAAGAGRGDPQRLSRGRADGRGRRVGRRARALLRRRRRDPAAAELRRLTAPLAGAGPARPVAPAAAGRKPAAHAGGLLLRELPAQPRRAEPGGPVGRRAR